MSRARNARTELPSYRDDDSAPIDPKMPDWWNERKKAERNARNEARKAEIRAENERNKIAAGNVISYRNGHLGGEGGKASALTKEEMAHMDRKANVGAVAVDGPMMDSKQRTGNNFNVDYMDAMDAEVRKKSKTADEELEGRSLRDLVDRGTLMVGCCLILVVVIAVTIPVALISEDQPYVAPPIPDPPSQSPTSPRLPMYEPIFEKLAPIAGGPEILANPNTAQNRALNWIVYEDGMELGSSKDHLHQRFVLMVIYFIAGPWTPVEGRLEWGSPVHECEWEGIFCKDVEELEQELAGRVDEILDSGRDDGIKIDVPQRIVNRLELRQRLVSGQVPAEFSLLYYLQHLDLENNQLVGSLPVPLYKLFNLQTLFLEKNQLTDVEAIGEYRFLEHLALSWNAFQGPLPQSFSNLKRLKTLYLHTNAFTGQVFDILKEFKSLEFLDIAFNEFSGKLPTEFGEMTNLTSLFIGHNKFSGEIPAEIGQCTKMKEFQIDGSHDVTGNIPTVFGDFTDLTFLKMDTCGFSGLLPTELGKLKKLTFMDLSSNDLEGPIPKEYSGLESIVTFAVANTDVSGVIPSELGELSNLEELNLLNTDVSGVMPQEICDLRNRENATVLKSLVVPCDVQCNCCTGFC